MNKIEVALAHELGNHIDDLVDSGITSLEMPDAGSETVGHLIDTSLMDNDEVCSNRFIVVLADGRRLRVTCEEMP